MIIAIGNVGSTSLKTKIIDIDDQNNIALLGEANLDRIKAEGESAFSHKHGAGPRKEEQADVVGFKQGINLILDWYKTNGVISHISDIQAVGFKTVLAGKNRGACRLAEVVLDEMKRFSFVAPAHNLPYVETIEIFADILGDVPLVGVFEPSFHNGISEHRRLTGLPLELERKLGVEQKGFHGSTGRYGAEKIRLMHNRFCLETGSRMHVPFRLIYNHLGGSSSTHAILDGKSIATSMRFSPQSGHYQGTRVGDIDVYTVLYAMQQEGLSSEEMERILSRESGLAGISGIKSGEMADIVDAAKKGDRRAALAIDAYIDNIRQYIGAFSTVLNGVDAIGFAGGIGEHSADIRAKICEGLEYLGLELDPRKNESVGTEDTRITGQSSPIQAYVVHTDEEMVVAYFTKKVVELGRDLAPAEMQFSL
jgi:acetate kinase